MFTLLVEPVIFKVRDYNQTFNLLESDAATALGVEMAESSLEGCLVELLAVNARYLNFYDKVSELLL